MGITGKVLGAGAAGVMCVEGGHGLPSAGHSWFQVSSATDDTNPLVPKLEPIREAHGTSAKTYLRKGDSRWGQGMPEQRRRYWWRHRRRHKGDCSLWRNPHWSSLKE